MAVSEFGGEEFSTQQMLELTDVIASGLLHFEVAYWSSESTSWTAQPGFGGPELAWDLSLIHI